MAALPDLAHADVVDLRDVRTADLLPLLEEETARWRRLLQWDFTPSAELVRRFTEMKALTGCALLVSGQVAGYSYFVCEEHKGLIGDLFVREAWAGRGLEHRLLEGTVAAIRRNPWVRRVEAQLLMFRHTALSVKPGSDFPFALFAQAYERLFMLVDLHSAPLLVPGRAASAFRYEPWTDRRQDTAARLIAEAYREHVDSRINDQYRSPAGARRFLHNIVQYPGCGHFSPAGSWVAIHEPSGELAGVTLASTVAPEVGHITQICVAPWVRGSGAGYELLRLALESMRSQGCHAVSLTVTAANAHAVSLYESVGFRVLQRFAAHVWEGW